MRTKKGGKTQKTKIVSVVKVTLSIFEKRGKQWSAEKSTLDTTDEVRSQDKVQDAVIFSWGRGIASEF